MIKSEDHFLEIVDAVFPNVHEHMLVGRGDDCAVLQCPEKVCLTSDLFVENVHFRLSYFSPADVGYKALAVNLSDLAANGARPLGFNLNLIWPSGLDSVFCRQMLEGMAGLAKDYDLALSGGDLSFGPCLALCVTIWGESPARNLLRRASSSGDVLFAAGEVGMARCGLMVLEKEPDPGRYPDCVARHLRPRPLVKQGLALAGTQKVKGLMDVSDGLARDLPRFLGPGAGIELEGSLPVHEEVADYCTRTGQDPVHFCLLGGEDYALLGACAPRDWALLQRAFPGLWKLGIAGSTPGIIYQGTRLDLKGFDHFQG